MDSSSKGGILYPQPHLPVEEAIYLRVYCIGLLTWPMGCHVNWGVPERKKILFKAVSLFRNWYFNL